MLRNLLCSALVSLFLVGCGDDSSTFYTAATGTIASGTAASSIASTASNNLSLSFTSGAGAPTFRRGIYDSCLTSTPAVGSTTDADGDNIPATQSITYACSSIASGNVTLDLNGTQTITDKDDTSVNGGFRYEFDLTGGHSGGESYTYSGFFDLAFANGGFTYSTNFKNSGSNTDTRATSTFEYGHTYTFTLTPTDASAPRTGGTISFSGFFRYLQSSTSIDVTLSITSENLTYQGSNCSNFYNSGSYTLTDAASNVLKVTFTDCNTKTTTFNGTAI